MTPGALAALALALGAVFGLGIWMIAGTVPRLSRPRLAERIAPGLTDVSAAAREVVAARRSDPSRVLAALLDPVAESVRGAAGRFLGDDAQLAVRLRQAGRRPDVAAFRLGQLGWGIGGLAVGGVLSLLAPASVPTGVRLLLPIVFAAIAVVACDQLLQQAARRRLARISEELPTVLEFLALSLTAGESLGDAIRRVARIGDGVLPSELAGVAARTATGVPLAASLAELRDGLEHPALSRTVDQLIGALDRGAPLAQVLRAQAGDARTDTKRVLLEAAGRKEIAMLVPLIFLILPITVVFALYPGFIVLQAGL